MKNIIKLFLAIVAVGVSLTGCDSKSKLARDLEGTWASERPIALQTPDFLSANVTNFMQFIPQNGVNNPTEGILQLSAIYSVTSMAQPSDSIVQPYSYTASVIASISGQWKVKDDDEVDVVLDGSTYNVSVDPQGVVLEDNILTGANESFIDSIKPALAKAILSKIPSLTNNKLFNINEIEDIRVKNNELKCEIQDRDYKFVRQAENIMIMNNKK